VQVLEHRNFNVAFNVCQEILQARILRREIPTGRNKIIFTLQFYTAYLYVHLHPYFINASIESIAFAKTRLVLAKWESWVLRCELENRRSKKEISKILDNLLGEKINSIFFQTLLNKHLFCCKWENLKMNLTIAILYTIFF